MRSILPITPPLEQLCSDAEKPSADAEELRAAAIEQVMRTVSDDNVLLPFLEANPCSKEAHAALGRLISEVPVRLVLGCPLMAFVSGTELDPFWRTSYPASKDSLWSNFEFLNTMYGPTSTPLAPYEALETLRSLALADLAPTL